MTLPVVRLTVLRSLGFVALSAIAVCNMVGQGVFLKARVMTCNVGSPLTMIAAWIVAGLLALCGSLTLAELSAALPESGGAYAFLRRAYGGAAAYSFGWMMLLIASPASTAALAAGAAIFFNLASGHALDGISLHAAPAGIALTMSGTQLAAAGLIAFVTAINCAPAVVNGRIASGFALLKIAMLVAVTAAAFTVGHAASASATQSGGGFSQSGAHGACFGVAPALRGGLAGFAAALVGALYAYSGWQSITFVAGEARDPGRTFPRAMATSVIVVIAGYVAANVAFVHVLGAPAIANLTPGTSVGVRVVETLLGPTWRTIAAALLFASVAATLHVTILTGARVVYALAQDGAGFRFLGRLSNGARVPVRALLANAALAIVLVLIGSFDTLSDYLVFNTWVYYVAAGTAVFVLRRREPQLSRPYAAFGYPFVPAIFIAVGVWLLVQTLSSNPRSSLIGLAIVGLSFPVYAITRLRRAGAPGFAE